MNKPMTGLLVLLMLAFVSCQNEEVIPTGQHEAEVGLRGGKPNDNGKGSGKGKGGKNDEGDGTGEEDPVIEYGATYQLLESDEFDPLYRFSFSLEGDQVLLQTDSTITTWGTDYWGGWADPFAYSDGIVQYINGLTFVTYEFDQVGDDMYDVVKTLMVSSYNSDHVDTTVTHPGLYVLSE